MLICHCRAVNDQTIRATILAGARDPAAVSRSCGAGSGCGGCLPALLDLLGDFGDFGDRDAGRQSAARTAAA